MVEAADIAAGTRQSDGADDPPENNRRCEHGFMRKTPVIVSIRRRCPCLPQQHHAAARPLVLISKLHERRALCPPHDPHFVNASDEKTFIAARAPIKLGPLLEPIEECTGEASTRLPS